MTTNCSKLYPSSVLTVITNIHHQLLMLYGKPNKPSGNVDLVLQALWLYNKGYTAYDLSTGGLPFLDSLGAPIFASG